MYTNILFDLNIFHLLILGFNNIKDSVFHLA